MQVIIGFILCVSTSGYILDRNRMLTKQDTTHVAQPDTRRVKRESNIFSNILDSALSFDSAPDYYVPPTKASKERLVQVITPTHVPDKTFDDVFADSFKSWIEAIKFDHSKISLSQVADMLFGWAEAFTKEEENLVNDDPNSFVIYSRKRDGSDPTRRRKSKRHAVVETIGDFERFAELTSRLYNMDKYDLVRVMRDANTDITEEEYERLAKEKRKQLIKLFSHVKRLTL